MLYVYILTISANDYSHTLMQSNPFEVVAISKWCLATLFIFNLKSCVFFLLLFFSLFCLVFVLQRQNIHKQVLTFAMHNTTSTSAKFVLECSSYRFRECLFIYFAKSFHTGSHFWCMKTKLHWKVFVYSACQFEPKNKIRNSKENLYMILLL